MKQLSIALVIIATLGCALGAEVWLDKESAEGWATVALVVLTIGGFSLLFSTWDDDQDSVAERRRDEENR